MKTAALIAFPLLCGLAFAIAFLRTFRDTVQPADDNSTGQPDRAAAIDAAITAETHPGRRMALLMIREDEREPS